MPANAFNNEPFSSMLLITNKKTQFNWKFKKKKNAKKCILFLRAFYCIKFLLIKSMT